jgi:hypothetical protein
VRTQALPDPSQTLEVPCDPYGGGLLNIPPLSHRVRARAPLLESEPSKVPPPSFFGTGLRALAGSPRPWQTVLRVIDPIARTLPRVGVVDGPARTLFRREGAAHRPRQIASPPKTKRGAGAEALAPNRCGLAGLEGTGETGATRAAPRSHSTVAFMLLAGAGASGTLRGPSQRLAKPFFTAGGFLPFAVAAVPGVYPRREIQRIEGKSASLAVEPPEAAPAFSRGQAPMLMCFAVKSARREVRKGFPACSEEISAPTPFSAASVAAAVSVLRGRDFSRRSRRGRSTTRLLCVYACHGARGGEALAQGRPPGTREPGWRAKGEQRAAQPAAKVLDSFWRTSRGKPDPFCHGGIECQRA